MTMAEPIINEMTGEVTFDLAGKPFRLRATMPRVAQLQAELGIVGLGAISVRLAAADATAIYLGLKCLCAAADDMRQAELARLDDALLTPSLVAAQSAIMAALEAGLPVASAAKKKVAQERPTSRSSGDDIAR